MHSLFELCYSVLLDTICQQKKRLLWMALFSWITIFVGQKIPFRGVLVFPFIIHMEEVRQFMGAGIRE